MSSVALFVLDLGSHKAKASSVLMKFCAVGVASIQESVESKSPILVRQLFSREDPRFPLKLVELLGSLNELGCDWKALELLPGQSVEDGKQHFEITLERLQNMIVARERSLAHQRFLADMESGEDQTR